MCKWQPLQSKLISTLTNANADKMRAAVWMVYSLVAVCLMWLISLRIVKSLRSELWIFLFNSSVVPPFFSSSSSQEIKCDFHIFSLSLSFLSMNVISIPLLAQRTGHVPGACELAFLKCWLAGGCPLRYLSSSCLQALLITTENPGLSSTFVQLLDFKWGHNQTHYITVL